jgi:hypothetical protein
LENGFRGYWSEVQQVYDKLICKSLTQLDRRAIAPKPSRIFPTRAPRNVRAGFEDFADADFPCEDRYAVEPFAASFVGQFEKSRNVTAIFSSAVGATESAATAQPFGARADSFDEGMNRARGARDAQTSICPATKWIRWGGDQLEFDTLFEIRAGAHARSARPSCSIARFRTKKCFRPWLRPW